ncbi:hypothetical protein [Echinimonas agarilytica]|uniref:Uncharacterized protein n=1 Tax=Echinimonas agarilytica TaxID=1215918 RepID=A0AA42B5Y2_9GAMM|nr:hypothetical protein [Echinimonas agarilytica]MCM2678202.1 hypothetical protein [Echinimonas agarilytica]
MKRLLVMLGLSISFFAHSYLPEIPKELYVEQGEAVAVDRSQNQGQKIDSIEPNYFMGEWKISQSLYVKTPFDMYKYFFLNNEDTTIEFIMTDDKSTAAIRKKYTNYTSEEGDSFYCHRIDNHKKVQGQLMGIFGPKAYKAISKTFDPSIKEKTPEWRAREAEVQRKISAKGKGLWKKYPDQVISLVKTQNGSNTFISCGAYFYVGKHSLVDAEHDFYLGSQKSLSIDVIDHNKFIMWHTVDEKMVYSGEYAIFERL